MAKQIKRIRKRIGHRIEKSRLKKEDDQVLIERAGELIDTDQEIAIQILGMVKDPNTKISGLGELHESLDSDQIKNVVNTLAPEEKPLLFEEEPLVQELKNMKGSEGNGILRDAIGKTRNQVKKLERLYDSAEVLGDYDVIGVLKGVEQGKFEAKKLQIIARKVASNYWKFGTSMHIRELAECISDEELRKEIPQKTAEEFEKIKQKSKRNNNTGKEAIEESIETLMKQENNRYLEKEKIKKQKDKKKEYGR